MKTLYDCLSQDQINLIKSKEELQPYSIPLLVKSLQSLYYLHDITFYDLVTLSDAIGISPNAHDIHDFFINQTNYLRRWNDL